MKQVLIGGLLAILIVGGALAVGRFLGWGFVSVRNQEKVIVVGEGKGQQRSQVARINAGVMVINDSKEEAVRLVNEAMTKLVEKIKATGVVAADIKTTGLSMYQEEETYYDNGVQKRRPTSWRVSNNVELVVRQVDKVDGVMAVLTASGATNVNGPYYSVEDQGDELDQSLRKEAFDDAVTKGEQIAKLSGRKLGRVLSVEEGAMSYGQVYPAMGGGGGGGGYEPGTSAVGRTITVEFALE
jgi:uncharacterized protein